MKAKREQLVRLLEANRDDTSMAEDIRAALTEIDDLLTEFAKNPPESAVRSAVDEKQVPGFAQQHGVAQQRPQTHSDGVAQPGDRSATVVAVENAAASVAAAVVRVEERKPKSTSPVRKALSTMTKHNKSTQQSKMSTRGRMMMEWNRLLHEKPWDDSPNDCAPRSFAHLLSPNSKKGKHHNDSLSPDSLDGGPSLTHREQLQLDPNAPLPWSKKGRRMQVLAKQKNEIIKEIGEHMAQGFCAEQQLSAGTTAFGKKRKRQPPRIDHNVYEQMNVGMYREPEEHPERKKSRKTVRQSSTVPSSDQAAHMPHMAQQNHATGASRGGDAFPGLNPKLATSALATTVNSKSKRPKSAKPGAGRRPASAARRRRPASRPASAKNGASKTGKIDFERIDFDAGFAVDQMISALEGVANATCDIQKYYIERGEPELASSAVASFPLASIGKNLHQVAASLKPPQIMLTAAQAAQDPPAQTTVTAGAQRHGSICGLAPPGGLAPGGLGGLAGGLGGLARGPRGSISCDIAGSRSLPFRAGAPGPGIPDVLKLEEAPFDYGRSRRARSRSKSVTSVDGMSPPKDIPKPITRTAESRSTTPHDDRPSSRSAANPAANPAGEVLRSGEVAHATVQFSTLDSPVVERLRSDVTSDVVKRQKGDDLNAGQKGGERLHDPRPRSKDASANASASETSVAKRKLFSTVDLENVTIPEHIPSCGSALGGIARNRGVKYDHSLEPQPTGFKVTRTQEEAARERAVYQEKMERLREQGILSSSNADLTLTSSITNQDMLSCDGENITAAVDGSVNAIVVPALQDCDTKEKSRLKSRGHQIEAEFLSRVSGAGMNAVQMLRCSEPAVR